MYKNVTCDTSQKGSKEYKLLSSDWSKITFIFRMRSVARFCWGQTLVSLEKKMKNFVFERVTNV